MFKLKSKVYLLVFEAHAISHENLVIFDEVMGLRRCYSILKILQGEGHMDSQKYPKFVS